MGDICERAGVRYNAARQYLHELTRIRPNTQTLTCIWIVNKFSPSLH